MAEYIAAVEQTAACVEAAGYSVGDVEPNPDGITYGFGMGVDGDDAEAMDELDATYNSCAADHLDSVQREYLVSQHLTGEEREHAYRAMISCFEDAGLYGVEVGDSEAEVGQRVVESQQEEDVDGDEAQACLQRYLIPLFGA